MSWHHFRPYVPVAQRRKQAEKAAKKLAGKGRVLEPVHFAGRAIATTFWGKAWCTNLESYSDYANRLPRGRTYVRNGSVIDLQISSGTIEALVQGSSLYRIKISIDPLSPKRWRDFKDACAGTLTNLFDLLQGRLSKEILADITAHGTGLFPSPAEIKLGCSCPDWADMCKHVAAVLYGVGARLDSNPEHFFTLRGVDRQELITAAGTTVAAPLGDAAVADAALAGADLSELFGVDIEAGALGSPQSTERAPLRRTRAAKKTQLKRVVKKKNGAAKTPPAKRQGRTSPQIPRRKR